MIGTRWAKTRQLSGVLVWGCHGVVASHCSTFGSRFQRFHVMPPTPPPKKKKIYIYIYIHTKTRLRPWLRPWVIFTWHFLEDARNGARVLISIYGLLVHMFISPHFFHGFVSSQRRFAWNSCVLEPSDEKKTSFYSPTKKKTSTSCCVAPTCVQVPETSCCVAVKMC